MRIRSLGYFQFPFHYVMLIIIVGKVAAEGGRFSCHFVSLRSFVWSISFISNNYPIYLIERPDIADALAQKYLYFIIMTMTPCTAFLVLSIPPAVQRKSILNQLLLSISEFCYPHIHPPLWHSLTKSIFHYPPSGGE